MKLLRISLLTVALTAISMLAISTWTAHGVPRPAAPSHHTAASADGRSITSTLRNATFETSAGGLSVIDDHGAVVDRIPLSVTLAGVAVTLRANVSADHTRATFTPDLNASTRAAIAAGVHPASAKKDRAYQKMIYHIQNGWNRGGGVATAVGALVGLIAGCLVIVGCIWGAGVGAAIGAVIGINNGDRRAGQAVLDWINTP